MKSRSNTSCSSSRRPPVLFPLLFILNMQVHAYDKAVYGDDDRLDVREDMPAEQREWARASAALVLDRNLQLKDGRVHLNVPTLGQAQRLCPGERFLSQPVAATCSGFLVAPDLVVTAGHCLNPREAGCGPRSWVFDFALRRPDSRATSVEASSVYRCTKVLARVHRDANLADYAVVKLDRPVTGRRPLPIRSSGKVPDGASLVMIGHPSGLPVKVAGGAWVRENDARAWFSANLDAFGKNSGSAVLNARTGEVEGILVRGDGDYERDGDCLRPKKCDDDGCRGEGVTRITELLSALNVRP